MRYAALDGGKRVRPLLVYAAGEFGGAADSALHPIAAAAALAAILERLAAYHRSLEGLGVTREHLVETSASILYQIVTGRRAP